MDTEQALITALYYKLKADETLKSLMGGGVELELASADPDKNMPYLVHQLDTADLDPWVLRSGRYTLDIWTREQTPNKVYAVRKRLVSLLDRAYIGLIDPSSTFMSVFQVASGNPIPILIAARLYLSNAGLIPEPTKHIWHYVLQFDMRFTRSIQEIEDLT